MYWCRRTWQMGAILLACVSASHVVFAGGAQTAQGPPGGVNALSFPGVKGDGQNDDTEGLQAALDTLAGTVYLPSPAKYYLIRRALIVHSGQTLLMDRNAVIRLADKADSLMLTNAEPVAGDRGITVWGGIWDGNNANQTPHDFSPQVPYDPARFLGVLIQFNNVRSLQIADLTLKDPESFAVQLANLEYFTIENIDFDYNLLRPNMDGIHLNGNCRYGRIANLKGTTNDDLVALNADDGSIAEMARGPISDIQVDGLFSDNGYTAVRLLSAGSPVSRIRLSNIFGTYRYNVVSFTHHNVHPGAPSVFESVVIDGIFCSKPGKPLSNPLASDEWGRANAPLIWAAPGTLVESLTVRNLERTECTPGSADTIVVDAEATVESLYVTDARLVNKTESEISLIRNAGTIGVLNVVNASGVSESGSPRGSVIHNLGTIREKNLTNVTVTNMAVDSGQPSEGGAPSALH